ncbi:hypothetical protein [Streptomyces buecherae]|nr:hypothetical protein [Streptomyces buecherae]
MHHEDVRRRAQRWQSEVGGARGAFHGPLDHRVVEVGSAAVRAPQVRLDV